MTWLPWFSSCEAKSALSWSDPMPVVRSMLHRLTARHGRRSSQAIRRRPEWIAS